MDCIFVIVIPDNKASAVPANRLWKQRCFQWVFHGETLSIQGFCPVKRIDGAEGVRRKMRQMDTCFWSGFESNHYAFCEQQLCSLVVEPANTWSNIGYLIVAIFIFRSSHVQSKRVKNFFALSTLCLFFGSMSMHATGTSWGMFADVSAMFFLSNVILTLSLERFFQLCEKTANLLFLALMVFSLGFLIYTGSGGKLFLLQIIVAAVLEYRLRSLHMVHVWQSTAFFVAAFTFWLLDTKKILCWPENHILTGHSMWHLLAAGAIWVYFLAYRAKKINRN